MGHFVFFVFRRPSARYFTSPQPLPFIEQVSYYTSWSLYYCNLFRYHTSSTS